MQLFEFIYFDVYLKHKLPINFQFIYLCYQIGDVY